MPQQREPQNESTSPNGPRASSGLVPRLRAKVPHVVVQSRSLEDASSPHGAPSQRPGDNSTRIARTTAKRHSTPAPKFRSSAPDASSWLLSPRTTQAECEPRGCPEAESTRTNVRRIEEGLACVRSAAIGTITQRPGHQHERPQWDHALPDKRAPDAAHRTTAAQNSIDSTTTTHLQYLSKREQKTPQKTLLTTLSNRTTS